MAMTEAETFEWLRQQVEEELPLVRAENAQLKARCERLESLGRHCINYALKGWIPDARVLDLVLQDRMSLDADRDAETVAQRTVESISESFVICKQYPSGELESVSGDEVLRSLAAPERVCKMVWHKAGAYWRTDCGMQFGRNEMTPVMNFCGCCGDRIEIKEHVK